MSVKEGTAPHAQQFVSIWLVVNFLLLALWWKNVLSILITWKANKEACFFPNVFTRV